MSKAYICDVCGKAFPKRKLVRNEGIDVSVELNRVFLVNIRFYDYFENKSNIDVCNECGKKLVFKALRKLEKRICEASKTEEEFSILKGVI